MKNLLAMETPINEMYCYHYNAIGSTIAMTNQKSTKKRIMLKKIILMLCLMTPAMSFADELPVFFESLRYEPFFPGGINTWKLNAKITEQELTTFQWINENKHELLLKYRNASPTTIENVYGSFAKELDELIKSKSGQILKLGEFFAIVLINENESNQSMNLLYGTPEGAYLWKYLFPKTYKFSIEDYMSKVSLAAREHQYKTAFKLGNVIMGRWGSSIHEYAKLLLQTGDSNAETVYHHLLRTSPSNYEAHVEFISLTNDKEKKIESAKIVKRGAEEEKILNAASQILNEDIPLIDSYPTISPKDDGVKVILMPLTPINPWILQEVANTFESITTIPVVIRKLPETWKLPSPSRSVYRRHLEQIASKIWPTKADFSDWSLSKLQEELIKQAEIEGPQAVIYLKELYKKTEEEGGQWDADPLLDWLSKALLPYRSKDPNTMVVGLTEIDIYSGDSNFIFSLYGGLEESPVSLLSYARMRAKFTQESQSRKRLVERTAKELVPASLKRLGIPRSMDPTCPYSYSSGLERLDEKTLILSDSVKKEIQKIKDKLEKRL
ncbi:MAG: hypothetical protein HY755_05320 [Nitrospirae bacterium]|nr:hypothetical protein [Nitrospirota bacterium]